jgi:hypothetical protein
MPSRVAKISVSPRAAVHLLVSVALLVGAMSNGALVFIAAMAILVILDVWRVAQEIRSRNRAEG